MVAVAKIAAREIRFSICCLQFPIPFLLRSLICLYARVKKFDDPLIRPLRLKRFLVGGKDISHLIEEHSRPL